MSRASSVAISQAFYPVVVSCPDLPQGSGWLQANPTLLALL